MYVHTPVPITPRSRACYCFTAIAVTPTGHTHRSSRLDIHATRKSETSAHSDGQPPKYIIIYTCTWIGGSTSHESPQVWVAMRHHTPPPHEAATAHDDTNKRNTADTERHTIRSARHELTRHQKTPPSMIIPSRVNANGITHHTMISSLLLLGQ